MSDCGSTFSAPISDEKDNNKASESQRTKWNCDVDILEFLIDTFICLFPEPDCYNPCHQSDCKSCDANNAGCASCFPYVNDEHIPWNNTTRRVDVDDGIVDQQQLEMLGLAYLRAQ